LGRAAAGDEALLRWLAQQAAPQGGPRAVAALAGLAEAGRASSGREGEAWVAAREAVVGCLESRDSDARFQATAALASVGMEPARARALWLTRIYEDDAEVASEAARGLASLGELGCADEIARAWRARLPREDRAQVLLAAASLGAGLRDERAAVLAGLERHAAAMPLGLEACAALGALGAREAAPMLGKLARGWFTHRLLRVAASAALAQLGDPDGVKLLEAWFSSHHKDARGYAMERAGALGLTALRPRLLTALRDPRDYHSDTAAVALAALGGDEARAALQAAASDPRPEVRAEVARALRERGWAPEVLARLTGDPDAEVREAAREKVLR
jgi:HEAT repeat protein